MSNPEHPFSYLINMELLRVGVVIGLLLAFAMWRFGLHRSVALSAVAFLGATIGTPSWIAAALAAVLIIWLYGHFQNQNYGGLLTISQLASMFVRSLLAGLLGFKWGGRLLLVMSVVTLGGLHQVLGVSITMLSLLAVQVSLTWWLAGHLDNEHFDKDEGLLSLRGSLGAGIHLLRVMDSLLGHAWQAYRGWMLIWSVFVIYAMHKVLGVSTMCVLVWVGVLTVIWGAARDF